MTCLDSSENQSEALRRKSLGELGELFALKALVDAQYDQIRNLNDDKMNYPFADLMASKDGKNIIISVKARNKFQKDKGLNNFYQLGKNAYQNAKMASEKYQAEAFWMAIEFDTKEYSVFMGAVSELQQANYIAMRKCRDGSLGKCLVENKRHFFDFGFFGNRKDAL